jgi:hypothetical protein
MDEAALAVTGSILFVMLGGLILVAVWAALTPFETLGWWAGWFGDTIYHDPMPPAEGVRQAHPDATCYVAFLSGIGRVSGQTLSYRETKLLQELARRLPGAVIFDDVFPYSVNNRALTGQPMLAGYWRWALSHKLHGSPLIGYLINIRNLAQIGTALDRRYAPLYNQAVAEVLLDSLLGYQYDPEGVTPVFLIGYSGAATLAIGAITYLREWICGPVYLISLGGVFGSDRGLLAAEHVYHLLGTRDRAQVWRFVLPGRWPIYASSEWNRALRQRRVTILPMPGMGHTGHGGYLDLRPTSDGSPPYVEQTATVISSIIRHHSSPQTGSTQADAPATEIQGAPTPGPSQAKSS